MPPTDTGPRQHPAGPEPDEPAPGSDHRERSIELNGRRFTYRDHGGPGPVLLALHGHFGRASIFDRLARDLRGSYRVIALDQRGHGRSAGGGPFTPADYAADAATLLRTLDTGPAAVLGHSMGGAVAFQLAQRHPAAVRAMIIADMTVRNHRPETEPVLDVRDWPIQAESRAALGRLLEARGIPDAGYFLHSAVRRPDNNWELLFDYSDMMASQAAFTGDFSDTWTASAQPALLLRAEHSFLLTEPTAQWMASARPATRLTEMPGCGHWLYADDPEGFAEHITRFLDDPRSELT